MGFPHLCKSFPGGGSETPGLEEEGVRRGGGWRDGRKSCISIATGDFLLLGISGLDGTWGSWGPLL